MMTGGLLSWEGNAFPRLDLKAWNSRLFTAFFYVVLQHLQKPDAVPTGMDQLLRKELRLAFGSTNAMASFLNQMEQSPRYLNEAQATGMASACSTFLSLIEILALVSLQRGRGPMEDRPQTPCNATFIRGPAYFSLQHSILSLLCRRGLCRCVENTRTSGP